MRRYGLGGESIIVFLVALWLGGCATASAPTYPEQPQTVASTTTVLESRAHLTQPHVAMTPSEIEKLRLKITMVPFQEAPGIPIPPRQTYYATVEYLKVRNAKGCSPQLLPNTSTST